MFKVIIPSMGFTRRTKVHPCHKKVEEFQDWKNLPQSPFSTTKNEPPYKAGNPTIREHFLRVLKIPIKMQIPPKERNFSQCYLLTP